jgi:hypothetical protein
LDWDGLLMDTAFRDVEISFWHDITITMVKIITADNFLIGKIYCMLNVGVNPIVVA